jgi:phosphoribosylaminoimidazolecarboxamide formyltransferase/IMP cyclohydrolase
MPVADSLSARLNLRGALNPHQGPAWAAPAVDGRWPFAVLNGSPSYTNLLDATHAWGLAGELDACTGLPAGVSFKHVNPSGAAVAAAAQITAVEAAALAVPGMTLSPVATAYARARGANRMASYGDFVAVSRPVDRSLAELLRKEVSDGIIAPGFEPDARAILAAKKSGRYLMIVADPDYSPPDEETRAEGGIVLRQRRDALTAAEVLDHADPDHALTADVRRDLLVAIAAAKWTVSNAVVLAVGGQVIGVGAGQQSRIEATRIACEKAETWWLRRHPAVRELPLKAGVSRPERDNAIDDYVHGSEMDATDRSEWLGRLGSVAMASDGMLPFRDNIDRAARAGVRYAVHSGGSIRDEEVVAAAREHGITLLASGRRQFRH